MKGRIAIAPAFAAVMIFACSSNSTDNSASGGSDDGGENGSIGFTLAGNDFTDQSVRICGDRQDPSNPEYRCLSSLTPNQEECPCFNFTPDGQLVDTNGVPVVISDLCPSANIPPANWSFTYAIYDSPDCEGTQLNDGTHDFVCYDSRDLATQAHPNESVEPLNPGVNTNHIICTSENASKTWDFASCAITTTVADGTNTRYDCGCELVVDTCTCGTSGLTQADLEAGCAFDAITCDIVCAEPVPPIP
ncbi:MAG: hypothetical protein FWD73_13955 [Polyangiaceae bacterium]|nr:hypothetical protein [Polyangiaceae bacterium]